MGTGPNGQKAKIDFTLSDLEPPIRVLHCFDDELWVELDRETRGPDAYARVAVHSLDGTLLAERDLIVPHDARNDKILLLDFHELSHDPGAVLAQICDFLGIDHFIASAEIQNARGVDFQLDAAQRAELAEILRPDVKVLINRYGFEPAIDWLQGPS